MLHIHVKMKNQQEQRIIRPRTPPEIWEAWTESREDRKAIGGSAGEAVYNLLWCHGKEFGIEIVEHEVLC